MFAYLVPTSIRILGPSYMFAEVHRNLVFIFYLVFVCVELRPRMLAEISFTVHPNLTPRVHDAKRPRTRGVGFRWTVNEISAIILGRNSTQTNTK